MKLNQTIIVIKGAGEMATGIACRLYGSNFTRICMTEIPQPLAVRREVSFCEAVYDGNKIVEGIRAEKIENINKIQQTWLKESIPIIIDPEAEVIKHLKPDVVIDAIIAKKNLGTCITDAELVIGIGPGFFAGKDVHAVVESNRGHNIGRVIFKGGAEKDTGIPGVIEGFGVNRVFRSPKEGTIKTIRKIGDAVIAGDKIASVDNMKVLAQINGVLRGMIRDGIIVREGIKIGDIDPRNIKEYCYSISDKTMAIAGGVLEAILSKFNV